MIPTIIISIFLAAIVGLIIYKMVLNAKAGRGGCAGCSYANTCTAAKILTKKSGQGCPQQQKNP